MIVFLADANISMQKYGFLLSTYISFVIVDSRSLLFAVSLVLLFVTRMYQVRVRET